MRISDLTEGNYVAPMPERASNDPSDGVSVSACGIVPQTSGERISREWNMASAVRALGHCWPLRCEPNVLYLEIELDRSSSVDQLAADVKRIIEERLAELSKQAH